MASAFFGGWGARQTLYRADRRLAAAAKIVVEGLVSPHRLSKLMASIADVPAPQR
jgi:hypothetical protein